MLVHPSSSMASCYIRSNSKLLVCKRCIVFHGVETKIQLGANWTRSGIFWSTEDLTTYPSYCRRWEIYQEIGNTIYLVHTVDIMCYSGAEVFLLVINRKSFLSSFWFAVCTKYNFSYYYALTEHLSCRVWLHYPWSLVWSWKDFLFTFWKATTMAPIVVQMWRFYFIGSALKGRDYTMTCILFCPFIFLHHFN